MAHTRAHMRAHTRTPEMYISRTLFFTMCDTVFLIILYRLLFHPNLLFKR